MGWAVEVERKVQNASSCLGIVGQASMCIPLDVERTPTEPQTMQGRGKSTLTDWQSVSTIRKMGI